jgi:hypothetical protein
MVTQKSPAALGGNTGQNQNVLHSNTFRVESQIVLECFPLYNTHTDTRPAKNISLSSLVQMATTPRIGEKSTAPAITPYKAKGKTKPHAMAAEYSAIVIDHDHDDKTAEGIRALYNPYDIAYLAFTTSSHLGDGQGRWKVLIPFSGPVNHKNWSEIAIGFSLKVSGDPAQTRTCQIFYAPNKLTTQSPYEFIVEVNKQFVDPQDCNHPFINDALKAYTKNEAKKDQKAVKAIPMKRVINKTQGTIIEKVNQSFRLSDVLTGHGYKQKGKKYLSPNSDSGMAGVVILDGNRCYSHHGPADPLSNLNNGGRSLDVFGVLCILDYGADTGRALKEMAAQVNPEGQKDRQREYMQEQALLEMGNINHTQGGQDDSGVFDMMSFSMKGRSAEMREKMLEDKFVLGRLAILGQSTIFYAKPNAGKTLLILWLIIQAIKAGEINGEDIFYINADDTYKGLVYKLMIAEKYGFHMLAPGHGQPGGPEFKSSDLPVYLGKMIESKTAAGKIIILDTVKKNTDLMNKKVCSEFGEIIRQFISHGGTVIMLAHANKHRDEDKKIVYSGTADLVDDADCAYTIDIIQDDADGMRTIKFENFKSRGDVALEAFYRYDYQTGTTYFDRLDSITPLGDEERLKIEAQKKLDAIYNKNKIAIDAIRECIDEGVIKKTELIIEASHRSGISKPKIRKALLEHTGTEKTLNQFWFVEIGEKNSHTYHSNYGVYNGK